MDKIELTITPSGKIRSVYLDERLNLFKAIGGKMTVRRASQVEWEVGPFDSYKGWTVRAAHDPQLAIRIILNKRIVSDDSSAPLEVFDTREAALEAEQRFFWDLLPKEPREAVVYLTEKQFDELLEYSTTLPTGTTIGKKWKCQRPYGVPYAGPVKWYMGEYVEDVEPYKSQGMVGIKWTRIEILKERP